MTATTPPIKDVIRLSVREVILGDRGDSINTFYSTDGSTRVITLADEGLDPSTGGYIWMQATANNTPTGNEYPLVMDDGTSANLAGIRMFSGVDFQGLWFRGNSVNLASTTMAGIGVPSNTYNTRRSVGVSWDNATREIYVYTGGFIRQFTGTSQDITGLTRLSVGERDGSGTFDGTIHAFEIGDAYITPAQMERRIRTRISGGQRVVIAGGGQSLELGALNSQETGSDVGYQEFISTLGTLRPDIEIMYRGDAEGGSSLFKINNSASEYWWDEDTNTPGTMLTRLYNDLDEFDILPSRLSWSQGEQDALFLNRTGRPTSQEYKDTLQLMFEHIRTTYPGIQIDVKVIGRRTSGNTNDGGTQGVRDAQLALIDELDYVHFAGEQYHVPLFDDVHPTDVGYETIFGTQARIVAEALGATPESTVGMQIASVSRTSTTVTVTLTHDDGTDFTPTSGIEGFSYFSDGSEISITSAVRTDATTITLTLASEPGLGESEVLYMAYDRLDGVTQSNIPEDNAVDTMPIRSTLITLPILQSVAMVGSATLSATGTRTVNRNISLEGSATVTANGSTGGGLPAGALMWVHAADAASFANATDQVVKNLAPGGSDYDLILGAGDTSDTQDPTFVGTVGTAGAHFTTDGGDLFTVRTTTAVLGDLHRTDAENEWWFATTFRLASDRRFNMLSTIPGSVAGVSGTIVFALNGFLFVRLRSAGTDSSLWTHPTNVVAGTDYFFAGVVNKSTGNCRMYLNATTPQDVSQTPSTDTTRVTTAANVLSRDGQPVGATAIWRGLMFGTGSISDTDVDSVRAMFETLDGITY